MKKIFALIFFLAVSLSGEVEEGQTFESITLPDGTVLNNVEVLDIYVILQHDGGVETVDLDIFSDTADKTRKTYRRNLEGHRIDTDFAYETLQFGDNTKTVFSKLKKLSTVDRINSSGANFMAQIKLSGHDFYLYPHFDNRELYMVRIRGDYRDVGDFENDLRLDWEYLRNMLINKFGLPTISNGYSKTPYFANNDNYLSDVWISSTIDVRLSVNIVEQRYYAAAYIQNKSVHDSE